MEEQQAPMTYQRGRAPPFGSCIVDRCWALRGIVETQLTPYAAMPVHCCHKPGSSEHAPLAGIVSSVTAIKSDVI
eukprot:6187078-Pleurochrysis_carterae.AAC.3